MKVLSVQYEIEPFDKFMSVNVYERDNKFYIGLMTSHLNNSYCILKNIQVGALGYLANKKEINDIAEFFESYQECIEYLTGLTEEKFLEKFKAGIIEKHKFLLSIMKNQK